MIDPDRLAQAFADHERDAHDEPNPTALPDDCLRDVISRYAQPHKPGDMHSYEIRCRECGWIGMLAVTVHPAIADVDPNHPDGPLTQKIDREFH